MDIPRGVSSYLVSMPRGQVSMPAERIGRLESYGVVVRDVQVNKVAVTDALEPARSIKLPSLSDSNSRMHTPNGTCE
jgi:hypothetical protein